MPYSIQPGDIIEVRLNMTMNGQRLLNVCHYRNGEDEIPDAQDVMQEQLDQMFNGALGSVSGVYLTNLSDSLSLDYADMQVIYPLRRAYERFTINNQGTNANTALPQNVQMSVTKRSSFAGASGHGRIEIPGVCENHVALGKLTEDGLSSAFSIGTAWQEGLNLGTFVNAAPSYIYHRANPSLSVAWESITVQDTIRVARRRTVRLGE